MFFPEGLSLQKPLGFFLTKESQGVGHEVITLSINLPPSQVGPDCAS